MLQRSLRVAGASTRPEVGRLSRSLRFESTRVPSRNATMTTSNTSQRLLRPELKSIFGSAKGREEAHSKYVSLMRNLGKSECGLLSEKVLGYISAKDGKILKTALENVLVNSIPISNESLRNIAEVVTQMGELDKTLKEKLLLLGQKYRRFIELFALACEQNQSKEGTALLVSLYLMDNQALKATSYLFHLIGSRKEVKVTTIELVINNLLNPEQIGFASDLLRLVRSKKIEIYSRTLERFMIAAIDMKKAEICHSHYEYAVKRIFLTREYLLDLMDLIAEVGFIREVKKVYAVMGFQNEPDIIARYNFALVRCASRVGFQKGFHFLKRSTPEELRSVADYPDLLDKTPVSTNPKALQRKLKHVMNSHMKTPMKRIYLNFMLAKLSKSGNVELGLNILLDQPTIREFMDGESFKLLAEGILFSDRTYISSNVDAFVDIVEVFGTVNLDGDETILSLVYDMVINSESWFKAFKINELMRMDGFVINETHSQILREKSQKADLMNQFNEMSNCIPQNGLKTAENEPAEGFSTREL